MAILKFLNQNGEWEVAETPAAVKYTEQNLTDAQKAQVKANLGITENQLCGVTSYEPKLTKVGSDFTRYLYLGADKKRWMTAPEDVTLRATFQGGSTIDYKTSGYELEVDYNGTSYAINFNGVTVWAGSDTSSVPVSGKVGLMHNGNSNLGGYTGAFVAESFQFYYNDYTYTSDMSHYQWTLVPLDSESSIDNVYSGLRYYRKPGTGRSILLADSPEMTSSKVKVKMAGPAYEAGVVFRYVDEKNYSYAFVNWDSSLVHIYQVIDGVEHAIASSIQVVDHNIHSDLSITDASMNMDELHAEVRTVREDRKLYLIFNQKVKFDRLTLALAPAGILTEAGVAVNDYIVSFDNSSYNLADILKNGYNGVAQTAIVWDDNVQGYHGEKLPTDDIVTVWGEEHSTYKFNYGGEDLTVETLPKIYVHCENVLMSVSDDMYLCMSKDYLVQTVLRNYKIATQPTCIIATENIASAVQFVTILCGNETIATLSQADLKAMFLGTQGTPSFDWLTSPYETRLTIDGSVVSDLDFNGFDKEKNIISAYSAQACFISGVNGITGNSLANEYSIIMNPQIMSVNSVELGIETWNKVPGGALNVDLEVRGDSFKPVANKAVRDYVNEKVAQVITNLNMNEVMTNDEIDAICGVTILDASSGEVTF